MDDPKGNGAATTPGSSQKVQQLVLGAATGYSIDAILPFVLSLKKTGYCGRICLFVWDLDAAAVTILERLGVELYPCASDKTDKIYTVTGGRFFVFQYFLECLADQTADILLTDVRDVIFQTDPFAQVETPGIHFYFENNEYMLDREPFNASIIKKAYGEGLLQSFAAKPISCVGVIRGDRPSILDYLRLLAQELEALPADFFGSDQAAHNKILYSGVLPKQHLHPNETSAVMHLGLVPAQAIQTNAKGQVLNALGQVVSIVHQYDRHPALTKILLDL